MPQYCNMPGKMKLYSILLNHYGEQGWWPLPAHSDSPGFDGRGYRIPGTTRRILAPQDRFSVILGTVLTQNTNWNNAERALINLHKAGIFLPGDLNKFAPEELEELIRSSGYYRQKANRIKRVAEALAPWLHSSAAAVPQRDFLLAINGVGRETADSILLYAFDVPVFIADLYTRRFSARLAGEVKLGNYEEVRNRYEKDLNPDVYIYAEYHALIVRHGKEHCAAWPKCAGCPCRGFCRTAEKT